MAPINWMPVAGEKVLLLLFCMEVFVYNRLMYLGNGFLKILSLILMHLK